MKHDQKGCWLPDLTARKLLKQEEQVKLAHQIDRLQEEVMKHDQLLLQEGRLPAVAVLVADLHLREELE
jgi:hypothetical protein